MKELYLYIEGKLGWGIIWILVAFGTFVGFMLGLVPPPSLGVPFHTDLWHACVGGAIGFMAIWLMVFGLSLYAMKKES